MLAFNLHAQEFMTLKRARELALGKNEELKIANQSATKAEAEKAAAKTNYFPKLSGSAMTVFLQKDIEKDYYLPTYTPNSATGELEPNLATDASGNPIMGADGNPVFNMYALLPLQVSLQGAYMAGIKLEQPIYTGGKIQAGNQMAALGVELAGENEQLQRENTIVEADKTYWMYVSVQEKVKLAQSSVEMLDRLLKHVQDSYEVGLVNKNEVLKVQVKYNDAALQLQKAKSGLELTRMSLCRVTGLPFDTAIKTDSVVVISEMPLPGNTEESLTRRPEYQMLSKKIAMQEQQMKLTRADFLPTIGVSAGYNYFGNVELNNEKIDQGNINVMASVKIPIFHWNEGRQKMASANADKKIQELQLEKNAQLMQLEIERARLNLKDAWFRVKTTQSALDQATENLRISNDNYQVGRELMSDLLTAQTQWQKAYSDMIEAKTEHKLYETEYLRATSNLIVNEDTNN